MVGHMWRMEESEIGILNINTGISSLKKSQLYWFYETKASPTMTYDSSGKLTRTGHEHILVTRESATRGIFEGRSGLEMVTPINETHSNMVKFTQGSKDLTPVWVSRRKQHCSAASFNDQTDEAKLKLLTKSLCTPDENRRLEEVEERFQNTFDWIYDLKETQFTYWLQSGTGLFWINGKPGSGKSTLMKFIYQDPRTHELLSDWKKDKMIRAALFFHHCGNTSQKSFAGLLQSILFQIVSERSDPGRLLLEFYDSEERWSLSNLEKSFRKIVFQDEIPLRLCLFLDALDEYDGQLEFLCSFLKDLEEIQPSKTKTIKVCFSSRPWEIFTTAFRNTLGFGIQKFTQEDIRDYCLGCMRDQSENILQELVPNIVSQLDEYHAEIIKRIPYTNRWKAYAALEVIVRSTSTVTSEEVLVAIFGSNATTLQEGYNAWHAEFRQAKEPSFAKYATKKLKEYTGGLVEVVDCGWNTEYIQVFHQTVEDFVKDLQFKTLVLGEQAKITTENGYTFIGKALFMGHFATNSVPPGHFQSITDDNISGPLGSAAYAGLSLYIKESLISTPSILQDSHEELLSHAFFNDKLIDAERRRMGQDSVTIARLLLENGFTPDKDPRAFERVLNKISANGSDSAVINILPLLIDYGQQVNIRVPCTHNKERGDAYYTPLHAICRDPHFINLLLDKGADVNGPDWKNRTAVDWILAFVPEAHLEHLGLYYQSMSMLLERGGRTNTTTSAVREQCLEVLSRAGFQTETLRFEEPSAPRPKQKRRKKRHAPTRKTQNDCIIL
ncbi:hypothetical protein GGS24DRAFT_506817 [Hypoxylon argillaceum]|nr:hypothetical protein GGS24DRAFT_506817 [Hypoxylon argillaceum]